MKTIAVVLASLLACFVAFFLASRWTTVPAPPSEPKPASAAPTSSPPARETPEPTPASNAQAVPPDAPVQEPQAAAEPTGSVSGRLLGPDGRAVAGYHVYLGPSDEPRGYKVTTDAAGAFHYDDVEAGRYRIAARSPKALQDPAPLLYFSLEQGEKVEGLELSLSELQDSFIGGRVRNRSGQPVGEVDVLAQIYGGSFGFATSDAHGMFRIEGLAEGEYTITTRSRGYNSVADLKVYSGTKDLEITLNEAGTVVGRVVSADGKPVRAFEVAWMNDRSLEEHPRDQAAKAFEDASGVFRLEGVDVGEVTLLVRAPGHAPTFHPVPKVISGDTTDAGVIRLNSGAAVAGVIEDATHRPVEGVEIYINDLPEVGLRSVKQTPWAVSDVEGRFSIDQLDPGPLKVIAVLPPHANAVAELDVDVGEKRQVILTFSAGGRIEGVLRMGGKPLDDASVTAQGAGFMDEAYPDSEGRYTFEQVPPGEVQLSANALSRTKNAVAMVEEGSTARVDFELGGTASISGLLTLRGGPLPARYVVELTYDGSQDYILQYVNPDGAYKLDHLWPGTAMLATFLAPPIRPGARGAQGFTSQTVRVEEGQALRIDIELSEGPGITGELHGLNPGEQGHVVIVEGHVDLSSLTPSSASKFADEAPADVELTAEGNFRTLPLIPGEYTVLGYALAASGEGSAEVIPFAFEHVSLGEEAVQMELNLVE